jgi:hypothetical protein
MAITQSNSRILIEIPGITYLPDDMGNGFLSGLVAVLIFENNGKPI